jgi:putative phosphoribosyl transferase
MKFKDRFAAGSILGEILRGEIKKMDLSFYKSDQQVVVIGIHRGGVLTGLATARKLRARLGIVFVARIGAPHNQEITLGAVMEGGVPYFNQYIIDALNVPPEYIQAERIKKINELQKCKSKHLALYDGYLDYEIRDKTIILVDDGAASGSTLIASLRLLRSSNPRHLLVGVPIAPNQTINLLKNEADKVLSIFIPSDDTFSAVEHYYSDFSPITYDILAEKLVKNHMGI